MALRHQAQPAVSPLFWLFVVDLCSKVPLVDVGGSDVHTLSVNTVVMHSWQKLRKLQLEHCGIQLLWLFLWSQNFRKPMYSTSSILERVINHYGRFISRLQASRYIFFVCFFSCLVESCIEFLMELYTKSDGSLQSFHHRLRTKWCISQLFRTCSIKWDVRFGCPLWHFTSPRPSGKLCTLLQKKKKKKNHHWAK